MDTHDQSLEFPSVDLPQIDFEIILYARILKRLPNYIDVLKRQAELLSGRNRHAEALECDQRLAHELPHDADVHYNLACSLASLAQVSAAVEALSTAFKNGYRDFEHVETDPDLDLLRKEPEFQALLKIYRVIA
jgi:tetratricopeptide (TPR) repeat protein